MRQCRSRERGAEVLVLEVPPLCKRQQPGLGDAEDDSVTLVTENFFLGGHHESTIPGGLQGGGEGMIEAYLRVIDASCRPSCRVISGAPSPFNAPGVPSRTFYLALGSACAGEGGAGRVFSPSLPADLRPAPVPPACNTHRSFGSRLQCEAGPSSLLSSTR